jgi:hypothetical protein
MELSAAIKLEFGSVLMARSINMFLCAINNITAEL